LSKSFVYLFAKAREALYASAYASKIKYNRRMYQEIYPVYEDVMLPIIRYRKDGKRAKVKLRVIEPGHIGGVHEVFYSMGSIVFATNLPDHEKKIVYTFPPTTLESYLFFYLNPHVQEILADYLNKHRADLSKSFTSRFSLYASADEAIHQSDALPDVEVKDIRYMRINAEYRRFKGRIKSFYLDLINDIYNFGYQYSNIITYHEFSLIFTDDKDPEQTYWVRTNEFTLPYIASVAGLDKDLRSILRKLDTVVTHIQRSVLVLATQKRLVEELYS